MAKLAGGALGVRRGKVGAEVYSVTGGIQVVKQYQPVVANPNTDGQQLQRLKMMVVGKISKAITPDMLVGLGTRFKARAEFNKTMLRAAQARLSGDLGEWKARVPATALVFSRGFTPSSYSFGAAGIATGNRAVTIAINEWPEEASVLKLIAVSGGHMLDIAQDFMANSLTIESGTTGELSIRMPATIAEGANVYAIFGKTIEPAASLDRNGGAVSDEYYDLDGASTPTSAGIEWSESIWVDWVAAPTGGDNTNS